MFYLIYFTDNISYTVTQVGMSLSAEIQISTMVVNVNRVPELTVMKVKYKNSQQSSIKLNTVFCRINYNIHNILSHQVQEMSLLAKNTLYLGNKFTIIK